MMDSINLATLQISFLQPQLALIHIPLELYSAFVQPVFRLLFGEDDDEDAARISWTNRHDFLNITINTIECSVICARALADRLFVPLLQHYRQVLSSNPGIDVGSEEYIVIQVDGQGFDAGQRVLELTSPLAMAGISLFFVTTYFCDYILVPSRARRTVTRALEQRGFVFSITADAFVSQLSPASPILQYRSSPNTTSPPSSSGSVPSTPPAKDVSELQTRTFSKLRKSKISPIVEENIRLVNCAGNKEPDIAADEKLKNDLMQVLLATTYNTLKSNSRSTNTISARRGLEIETLTFDQPASLDFSTRFLSVTITSIEPISIFMEQRLIDRLGSSLLGAKSSDDVLVPIILDLRELPTEATGIVCGVAGRLAQGDSGSKQLGWSPKTDAGEEEAMDITFLSTAKAGTVLVRAKELDRAVAALEYGTKEIAKEHD